MSELATPVAVVCDPHHPAADAVRGYVAARGLAAARWYPLRDIDDVERAILASRVRRVVFASPQDLLTAAWNRTINPTHWSPPGVQIDFADSPPAAANLDVRDALACWQLWDRARRRRQAIAGVILSVVVLAAAFLLLLP